MDPVDSPPEFRVETQPVVSRNPVANLKTLMADLPPRLWQGKAAQAFWRVATLFSFAVNVALLALLLSLGGRLFELKRTVAMPLLDGVYRGFGQMDAAHITTNVTIKTEIPVAFDLPVQNNTVVTLTEPARIEGASVNIQTLGLSLNAPATVILPAGANLPITLNFSVPVQTTVPVELQVPVDIPLSESELHAAFSGMQALLAPYLEAVARIPDCWEMLLWGGQCR